MTGWEDADSSSSPGVDSRLRGNDGVGKCGTHRLPLAWIPAFAGMTGGGVGWEGADSSFAPRLDSHLALCLPTLPRRLSQASRFHQPPRHSREGGNPRLSQTPKPPPTTPTPIGGTGIGVDSRSAKTKSPDAANGRIRAKSTSASGLNPKGCRLLAPFQGPPSPHLHASLTTPQGTGRVHMPDNVGGRAKNLGGFWKDCPDTDRDLYDNDSLAL